MHLAINLIDTHRKSKEEKKNSNSNYLSGRFEDKIITSD